jgi:hypothetical protein
LNVNYFNGGFFMSSETNRSAYWAEMMVKQKESGQSVLAWCMEHKLSVRSFENWRARINKAEDDPGGWMTVPLPATIPTPSSMTLRIGIVEIDLTTGFDGDLLRNIIGALDVR